MKATPIVAVMLVLLFASPEAVLAQSATKTARACLQEYRARKPDLVGALRHRAQFIARCREMAIGVATPMNEAIGSQLDVLHPEVDYKHGYMFTPAYLSSPQGFNWLLHRPD